MSKKFDLEAFKKSIEVEDTPLKKDKFVEVDECLQELMGLNGWPLGHISMVYGLSDTSKTTLMFNGMAQAQKCGILPVAIITEGKVDWERAQALGVDLDFLIRNEQCDFLEDVFEFIDKLISKVNKGDLPYDVMIFYDSVGNTLSKDEITENDDGTWDKKATMMKASKVITENMRTLSKKINDTRKVSCPQTVGLFIINQAYTQPPKFPGGREALIPYGGKGIYYRASLIIRTARTKRLTATKDKKTYGYGIVAKISVEKNHISSTTNSGEFVVTANAIIPNEPTAIKKYKEENKEDWGVIDED